MCPPLSLLCPPHWLYLDVVIMIWTFFDHLDKPNALGQYSLAPQYQGAALLTLGSEG